MLVNKINTLVSYFSDKMLNIIMWYFFWQYHYCGLKLMDNHIGELAKQWHTLGRVIFNHARCPYTNCETKPNPQVAEYVSANEWLEAHPNPIGNLSWHWGESILNVDLLVSLVYVTMTFKKFHNLMAVVSLHATQLQIVNLISIYSKW